MGYFGSKATSGLCQAIIALMPPHDTYIETHLGGGAIMKRKPPALNNIGIDLDPKPLAAFECDYPVQRVNGCAHRFLAEYAYQGSELIYSDPPYLHHTRSSRRRYRFDYQEHDHIELLELLKTLSCNIIVSGYPSALYEERLSGWRSLQLQVMNQGVCAPKSSGSTSPSTGCIGRVMRARTSPTGNASSARPRTGGGATRGCPGRAPGGAGGHDGG